MVSAFPPTPQVRLRRALALTATLLAVGFGAAPARSAPLDGLFTAPHAADQPTPAPTPLGLELRPIEPPLILDPLPAEPSPEPAPAPAVELTPLLAPVLGEELTPLLAPVLGEEVEDDAGKSTLSYAKPDSSSTPSDEDSKALAAEGPQGAGSAPPEPTTGATAPEAGVSDQSGAAPSEATPSGTVTAATLLPVIDAVSRVMGSSRRSREIATTGTGGGSPVPVRVAPLGRVRTAASTGPVNPAAVTAPETAPDVRSAPAAPRVRPAPAPAVMPRAAQRVVSAVGDAGRSPWLPVALLLTAVSYVLGQRLMDGGSKLSHAGRDEPDDELIEL